MKEGDRIRLNEKYMASDVLFKILKMTSVNTADLIVIETRTRKGPFFKIGEKFYKQNLKRFTLVRKMNRNGANA